MQKYTVKLCQECGKRRRFYRIAPRMSGWASEQCSYGHCFDHEILTMAVLNRVLTEKLVPKYLEAMFKEDPLVAYMRSR